MYIAKIQSQQKLLTCSTIENFNFGFNSKYLGIFCVNCPILFNLFVNINWDYQI